MFAKLSSLLSAVVFVVGFAPEPTLQRSDGSGQPGSVAGNFNVQKIADGIYAVIRKDPPGLMVDANSVLIINDEDVVVVDTSGAPSTSKEVIAALRKLTNKPVSCVINTHWHDDHIRGNQVFRDAFPQAEFIAHAAMRRYMPDQGALNRKQFLEGAPQVVAQMRSLMQKNKNFSGGDLTEEERASYESDIRLAELALADAPSAPVVLPTLALENRITLHRGNRIIDVRHLGRGHTAGDLVVHLPKERIAIAGDLVVWPVPLIGSAQSNIGDWTLTLKRLRELQPALIVPGHGPLMHDDSYLKLLVRLFTSVERQVDAAVARGETLEQTRKSVNLDEFRGEFAGDSRVKRMLFATYVTSPAVAAAFREASAR